MSLEPTLFAGCKPEVAAFNGRILAVGPGARAAAGRKAEVVRLSGESWPGLIDSHIHLEGLADRTLIVDLTGSGSREDALSRVREAAKALPKDGKPITTWANRDEAFLDVARGIRRVVEELTKSS